MPAAKRPASITVRVLPYRAFVDDAGTMRQAGEEVTLPAATAERLVEQGYVERA